MGRLSYLVSGISEAGLIKETHEDSFVYKVVHTGDRYAGIFAVADGVGGLERGEVASAFAISEINKWWESEFKSHFDQRDYLAASLVDVFRKINDALIQYGKGNGMKTGTTLTVLLLIDETAIVSHVGDSRLYRLSGFPAKRFFQVTTDHSCMIEAIRDGQKYLKSVLTDCLGNKETFSIYTDLFEVRRNETFVISSDGIYKTISSAKLADIVRKHGEDVEKMCEEMIVTAKNNKETDNLSVIAVRTVGSK